MPSTTGNEPLPWGDSYATPEAEARDMTHLARAKALFLAAAGLSFVFSVTLWFLVDREQGLFVGLWVPSILALGSLLLSGREGVRS